ncbi:N-acetylglucosamine-6-phosphate deacetylase [Phenylobacterium sp. Root700]|uniref:N-acetylglucosamine-6-phosphate deacetylase n=1 Tax=Phenylobacterium sp. Root700 TaxID=1736591 RepID=UPI0006F666B9|nr:N-acetylglucosamine-6-phosphate deacetylase [Phenylobacterium sp. Root700]KRB44446.1 N-acetylglucosamine-6-phosphate deacetylase [Phenylobacterium sp. Root700]
MAVAFVNGQVLTDGRFTPATVLVEGGRIVALGAEADAIAGAEQVDMEGGFLVPGFIDTQVNGGGGLLFNDAPNADTIATIGAAHRKYGVTGFLPTLISDDLATVAKAIAAVDEAIEAGVPGVLGIHIEGPFLSERRKGVHDASKFRTLDEASLQLLTSARHGKTLVTLAPETTTPEMIGRLAAAGVTVAAGHTNATYDRLMEALGAGVTGFTHLFNAMSPLASREPGAVGAALDHQDSWCGVIIDGRHIHPAALRIAFRAKRHDRFMLVTDAMPSVGMVDKTFTIQGRPIRVVDGVCVDENGTLAGSDLDMASAVRNAVQLTGLDLADAAAMASTNPAAFLGLDAEVGQIAPGFRADLTLLGAELTARRTWIGGREV